MEGVYAVFQGYRSDHDDCHPPGVPGVPGRVNGLQHMAVRVDRRRGAQEHHQRKHDRVPEQELHVPRGVRRLRHITG